MLGQCKGESCSCEESKGGELEVGVQGQTYSTKDTSAEFPSQNGFHCISRTSTSNDECGKTAGFFKLFPEAAITATYLNNLVPVTLNGDTKSRWEHAGYEIPSWAKNLRTFGEARTIND